MAQRDGPQTVTVAGLPGHSIKLDKSKLQVPRKVLIFSLLIRLKVSNESNYNYLTAKANVGVKGGGKWYHEVRLDSNSQMLIGYVKKDCTMQGGSNLALGSDERSWGWDGYNAWKSHSGKNEEYGDRYWKTGDTIGVLLDLDQRKISYTKNGKNMGFAFTDIPKDQFLYPAVSLKRYQKVTFNFGATPFKFPDKQAFPLHMLLNDKQKGALEKLFEHYQKVGQSLSESQDDRGDICKADGVFQFATDAGAKDDTDPLLLIIAWKLNGEHPWEFSRDEWVRGFSLYGLHDIEGIKSTAQNWKKQTFQSDDNFKPFYNWCFDYLREDRKILSMEEVKTLWMMLAMESRWKLWKEWLDFLVGKKKREYLSRDEWCVILTFAGEHKNDVSNYDPDGAYPSLIDDFVDHLNGVDEDE